MKRLLPLLLLLSCAPGRLDLPPGAWSVEGADPRRWNEPLAFGPYRVGYPAARTRPSWLTGLGMVDQGKANEATFLTLNGVIVECFTDVRIGANSFIRHGFDEKPAALLCGLDRGGARWTLDLAHTGSADPALYGTLGMANARPYEVRSHSFDENSRLWPDPLGFAIGLPNSDALAIVDIGGAGRVWIAADAPDRDVIAAAAAALLLFRN